MTLLCLTCGHVSDTEYIQSPALARMRVWQEKTAAFWGQYPWSFQLLRTSMLWFALAILSAYFDMTREYTPIFVLLAVLVAVSREYIPLAPTPFNVYNIITSRDDTYSTAAKMILVTLGYLVFVGVFVVLAEQAGNVAYHINTEYREPLPSYWGTQSLPWLSVVVVVVPLLYFISLTVSNAFVMPFLSV